MLLGVGMNLQERLSYLTGSAVRQGSVLRPSPPHQGLQADEEHLPSSYSPGAGDLFHSLSHHLSMKSCLEELIWPLLCKQPPCMLRGVGQGSSEPSGS